MSADTLRAAITSALVARGSNAHTIDEHGNDDLALPRIAVLTAHATTLPVGAERARRRS